MDFALIQKAIDYYLSHSQSVIPAAVSVVAVVISIFALAVSVYTFRKHHGENVYRYLADTWNDVLALCHDNPRYLDILITENYETEMSSEERLRYDVYCYKAWGHVEDIVAKGCHKNPQFEPIVHWMAAYHVKWIERNPMFFTIEEFWQTIKRIKDEPQAILRYRPLPMQDGDLNWDIICRDYHKYILGPFAPEMITPKSSGEINNLLLRDLLLKPKDDLFHLDIADVGCGPGNVIPHLRGRVSKIYGIDKSAKALQIAENVARNNEIEFVPYNMDIRTMDINLRFDIIISANSILPQTREDILSMLKTIREHLNSTLSDYKT